MAFRQQLGNKAVAVVFRSTWWGVLYAFQQIPNFSVPVTAVVRLTDVPESESGEIPLPWFLLNATTLAGEAGALNSNSIYYATELAKTYAGAVAEFNYRGNHSAIALNLTKLSAQARLLNPTQKRVHFTVTFSGFTGLDQHVDFSAAIARKVTSIDVSETASGSAIYNAGAEVVVSQMLPWVSSGGGSDAENRTGCEGYFDLTSAVAPTIVMAPTF